MTYQLEIAVGFAVMVYVYTLFESFPI